MVAKFKKNKKTVPRKKMFFSILAVAVFIFLIVFLIRANVKINQRRAQYNSRIEALNQEIEETQERKNELEKVMAQAGSREHLEKIAREQLGMKNPGEEVVVISQGDEGLVSEENSAEPEKKNFWNPKYWWDWLTGSK